MGRNRHTPAARPIPAIAATLVAALLVMALAGCAGGSDTPNPGVGVGLSPACFTGGAAPILATSGVSASRYWNDPHVLKVGGQYWMYASSPTAWGNPVQLYRLTSADGVNWMENPADTPLLAAGSGWEAGGVETPAVVYFNGAYHLFYTGYSTIGDPTSFAIGHATSPDGVAWTRDPVNPIVGPSGVFLDFHELIVAEPAPVVVGTQLFLYFTAVGADAGVGVYLQTIGLVRSSDGTTWTMPEQALRPDQSVYPRAAGWYGYSTPNAAVLNGRVHLFFDVAHVDPGDTNWAQVRLHHAASPDGRTGWVQDTAPIARNTDRAWTAREVRSPAALVDGGVLRLYYAGDDHAGTPTFTFGIGLLTCPLL